MNIKIKGEAKIATTGDVLTVYELSYLLLPSLSPEQIPSKAAFLKETIQSAGGMIITDEDSVLIDLAYPMTKVAGTTRHKCNGGYFGWIKFEILKDEIVSIKKNLDASDEILRYLIIKTVRENTLVRGKMKLKFEERVKNLPVATDGGAVIDEDSLLGKDIILEDLDKSIDDLVII